MWLWGNVSSPLASARSHCGRSVHCQLAGASRLSVRCAAGPQLDPAGLQRADGDAAQVFLCKLWWSTTLPALLSISLFKSYLDIVWKMPPFFGLIKVCFLSIVRFLQRALESHAERLPVFVYVPFVFQICLRLECLTWFNFVFGPRQEELPPDVKLRLRQCHQVQLTGSLLHS